MKHTASQMRCADGDAKSICVFLVLYTCPLHELSYCNSSLSTEDVKCCFLKILRLVTWFCGKALAAKSDDSSMISDMHMFTHG